jgi:5-methylcytosine-specific restriction endonuclease McrA
MNRSLKSRIHRRNKNFNFLRAVRTINPCIICGSTTIENLEFHHIHPKDKRDSVSRLARVSTGAMMAELVKCVVLCTDCHNGLHNGGVELGEVRPLQLPQ